MQEDKKIFLVYLHFIHPQQFFENIDFGNDKAIHEN